MFAEEMLDKIKQIKGLDTDTELAVLLGVPNSTLNGWRKRNAIGSVIKKMEEKELISQVINGDFSANAPGAIAINSVQGVLRGDSEITKLLAGALSLGTIEEVKNLLQSYISEKIGHKPVKEEK